MKRWERDKKIRLALNRIDMDRVLYSKFNSSLTNILVKVWSYIMGNTKHKEEMTKRLLEELEDMSGTCSTGYATRLVNSISGFGDFSVRISLEEQMIANFTGRLNAAARDIGGEQSPFREEKLEDVVALWLQKEEHKEVRDAAEAELGGRSNAIGCIVKRYLSVDRKTKVETCLEDFAEAVLSEMTVQSSNYSERQNFALFFRTNVSRIREELYEEFKDLVDDTSFDLYFRKSLMSYEN